MLRAEHRTSSDYHAGTVADMSSGNVADCLGMLRRHSLDVTFLRLMTRAHAVARVYRTASDFILRLLFDYFVGMGALALRCAQATCGVERLSSLPPSRL